jgi:hypothetical protein
VGREELWAGRSCGQGGVVGGEELWVVKLRRENRVQAKRRGRCD